MNTIDQRSTAELWRLRNRAENPTVRDLLNAELRERFEAHPVTQKLRKYGGKGFPGFDDRNFLPGQP